MFERTRSQLQAYIVAFISTGASLLLQWPLQSVVGPSGVFLVFLPAVILSADSGGIWTGLLATFLSTAAADFLLIQSHYSFWSVDASNAVTLSLFLW